MAPSQSGHDVGDRRRVGLVDMCRTWTARFPTVVRTGAAARTPAASLRPVLGEGGGLPEPGPARSGQLALQPLVFPLQAPVLASQAVVLPLLVLGIALAPRHLRAELLDLVVRTSNPLTAGVIGGGPAFPAHTRLIRYSREKYNPKTLDLLWRPAKQRHQETLQFLPSIASLLGRASSHVHSAAKNARGGLTHFSKSRTDNARLPCSLTASRIRSAQSASAALTFLPGVSTV